MLNLDKLVNTLEDSGKSHQDYMKVDYLSPVKGLFKGADTSMIKIMIACLVESLVAFLMKAETFELKNVFRFIPEDVRDDCMQNFKESFEYKTYLEDIFFDQSGRGLFNGEDEMPFSTLVMRMAIIRKIANATSEGLMNSIQEYLDNGKDPLIVSGEVDLEELISQSFNAVSSGVKSLSSVDPDEIHAAMAITTLALLRGIMEMLSDNSLSEQESTAIIENYLLTIAEISEAEDIPSSPSVIRKHLQKIAIDTQARFPMSQHIQKETVSVGLFGRSFTYKVNDLLAEQDTEFPVVVEVPTGVAFETDTVVDHRTIARQAIEMDRLATHFPPPYARLS